MRGLQLVRDWIRQPTCLESDCLTMVSSLSRAPKQRSESAGILMEIGEVMQLLPQTTIGHIRREANSVAHDLAQRALKFQECVVMQQNVPLRS
jgi:hypothetical protein